ncbi:GyrI-like domain-containing protein [Chungangia koreensis]|uniref:GyrI-like domain-containing protein n=1 Tax=Chungangia koreensis TaxID=752657 RepID=A0ABV8X0G2_9LACT
MVRANSESITIIELPESKLVGFRVLCHGDQYANEIPKASSQLSERLHEVKHVINPDVQIGAFVVENETDEEDGYWVCVEVTEFEDIPSGMVVLTIPSQHYAVVRYEGPNYEIRSSYEELHLWIEKNNYNRLLNKWHLERFYKWTNPEKIEVELLDTIE